MNKLHLICLLFLNINVLFAQNVDLTSVDEFFRVTSSLMQGHKISEDDWRKFDNSNGYKSFAESESKFLIKTIKSSIQMVFGKGLETEKDSILRIPQEEIAENHILLMRHLILKNYQDVYNNYLSIKSFRNNYDFESLLIKSKQRLSFFLGKPIDSTIVFKSVYFFFLNSDGKDAEDAIYIDLNLLFNMSEQQRIDFIAHEYFHNYRRHFENHNFNHKCDLNFMLDMIQNEGIADQIDKSQGYERYYSEVLKTPLLTKIMVHLYNQAEGDLAKIQTIILQYSQDKISESAMIDALIEVYKYNGHPIGFFMSNQIIKAGYREEMINTFYIPYEFYKLYNLAAIKNGTFQFSNEFMDYLLKITQ